MVKLNQEAEKLLWKYYNSQLTHIKRNSWGNVYKDRHQNLIDEVKDFAKKLGIKKLTKFKPLEREDG
jgi:hypothetical protein